MSIQMRARLNRKLGGVVRGVIAAVSENGEPQVDFARNSTGAPVTAVSIIPVRTCDICREAVLMFEDGDPSRPVLLGLVASSRASPTVEVDGERLSLVAQREIVLRCGEASITLTRSGKVLIRGKYVLSRSTGVNMVKGGVVHLN